jgi:hypothetical protein
LKTKVGLPLLLLFLLCVSLGCKPVATTQLLEISPAPIHEIKISYAKSNPPQVVVTIKGGLPDGCSKFHDLRTNFLDETVNIEVTIERPKGSACPAIYGYFDQTVNLGSQFSRGEAYIIKVNDQSMSFTMQ